jgi:predicted nuclease with TOPRIM domain
MIKQDKLDGHTEQRERYESLRVQNNKLQQCYSELTQHLRELRTKYNDIQDDNSAMLSKLSNELLKHK